MLIIHVDHPLTKRRKITAIMDEKDVLLWSGPSFNDAIAWLAEAGETEVRVCVEERYRVLSFGPLLDKPSKQD